MGLWSRLQPLAVVSPKLRNKRPLFSLRNPYGVRRCTHGVAGEKRPLCPESPKFGLQNAPLFI